MSTAFIFGIVCVDEPKDRWLQIIRELETHDLESIMDDIEDFYPVDDCLDDEMRSRLREAVEVCYDERNTAVGWCVLDDKRYAVSGGMAWGDAPTDECWDIWLFTALQDYYKEYMS